MSGSPFPLQTLEEVRNLVSEHKGLAVLTMGDLKTVFGHTRLGVRNREDMSRQLHAAGLGHFPPELPRYHYEEVRVFNDDEGLLADIIHAVLKPSASGDETLRRVSGGDAAVVLAKIRTLIAA
jgi:hypothetical protein